MASEVDTKTQTHKLTDIHMNVILGNQVRTRFKKIACIIGYKNEDIFMIHHITNHVIYACKLWNDTVVIIWHNIRAVYLEKILDWLIGHK